MYLENLISQRPHLSQSNVGCQVSPSTSHVNSSLTAHTPAPSGNKDVAQGGGGLLFDMISKKDQRKWGRVLSYLGESK